MKSDESQPEDIAGLFKKFGGDPHDYKEFERPVRAAAPWALLTQPPAAVAPDEGAATRSNGSVSALFASEPKPALPTGRGPFPPGPGAASSGKPAPAPRAAVAASARPSVETRPPGDATDGRELDAIFDRLLGAAGPSAAVGHGLLAQWRRHP